jgi:hypothetical protein
MPYKIKNKDLRDVIRMSECKSQKPEALTTFGQSDSINNIYLDIMDLALAMNAQCFPAVLG